MKAKKFLYALAVVVHLSNGTDVRFNGNETYHASRATDHITIYKVTIYKDRTAREKIAVFPYHNVLYVEGDTTW